MKLTKLGLLSREIGEVWYFLRLHERGTVLALSTVGVVLLGGNMIDVIEGGNFSLIREDVMAISHKIGVV